MASSNPKNVGLVNNRQGLLTHTTRPHLTGVTAKGNGPKGTIPSQTPVLVRSHYPLKGVFVCDVARKSIERHDSLPSSRNAPDPETMVSTTIPETSINIQAIAWGKLP